jgi:hypothetical protein
MFVLIYADGRVEKSKGAELESPRLCCVIAADANVIA